MAKKATYTVAYRRKREGKTHYGRRLELLKSNKQRLVIRKSNTSITIQFIQYTADGDKVLAGYNSAQLEKAGWKHSKKSLPAAYLAGAAAGAKAKQAGVSEVILDLGLQTPHKGSKLYAALKGVVDAGIIVPCSEEVFPTSERLAGEHIQNKDVAKDFEATKQKVLS